MPQVRAAAQPTTLGRYTLIERLGVGGQGEVWRAQDESRGVDIALKILAASSARNPAAWEALEREHAIASRLQHPGILQVLAPERLGNDVVLPMELASGGDLRRLRGAGYLEIVPVLLEVAEALEYAHARGVVHRDLKPGNVLFDNRGRVKLGDFGIAALLPVAGGAVEQRSAGHSPFTASPEQLRGEPPSPADDIYGLGALAYELLSGHPPYYPNFDLRRAQTQPVPQLVPTRQIPPELGELVMRMLAKSAAARPASMQQVMDELDATLNATLSFAPEGVESADPDADPDSASPEAVEQKTPEGTRAAPSESCAPLEKAPTADGTEKRPQASVIAPLVSGTDSQRPRIGAAPKPARPRPMTAGGGAPAAPASAPLPLRAIHEPPRVAHGAVPPTHDFVPPFEPVSPGDPFDAVMQPRLRGAPPPGTRHRMVARSARGRARHWPYLVSGLLCGAALICAATAAALFWLPRHDRTGLQRLLASIASAASPQSATPAASEAPPAPPVEPTSAPKLRIDPAALARFNARRADFDRQAAALDPGNAPARSGLARANASFGGDNYARSVGAGFAALGAGRLADARADFQQALAYRPRGREATAGLRRVGAAMQAGRIAALRQRAAVLESQERWRQAAGVYDAALREDPALTFARRDRARDEARAALSANLQRIIDHPELLTVQSVRDEAVTLLQQAREVTPSGPMLQSQTERLAQLLPQLDRPVVLDLISDNATQVTIPSIGEFGAFGRREIRLKPGTYTVIGTRDGYRAVHQEFTVEPGQQAVTITVSCSEPI